jgi:predicted nucleic acid-binding protein
MNSGTRTDVLDKVLIDTSVWIDFFRKKEPHYSAVSELIDEDSICCIGIVLAELLQGAKSEKELGTLKEFLHVFDFLPESAGKWQKAGELSFSLQRKGRTAGLSDCYIAVAAKTASAALYTLDRHFSVIEKELGLKLYRHQNTT